MDDDDATDLDATAGGAIEHDVVAPLELARHLLSTVLDEELGPTARERVAIVVDALDEAHRRAMAVVGALRPPPPGRLETSSLRGLVEAGWNAAPEVADPPTLEVDLAAGLDDRVLADVARVVAVLADLVAFARCGAEPPTTVVVALSPADGGIRVGVADDSSTPAATRAHHLGRLWSGRTRRIVGAGVTVEETAAGVEQSVIVSEDLVRGAT